MHQDAIARLNENVIQRFSSECVAQIDAKNPCRAVRPLTEELRRVEPRIRRHAPGLINRVAQVLLTGRPVLAGRANLASDQHFGIRLKIKSPEDAYGV